MYIKAKLPASIEMNKIVACDGKIDKSSKIPQQDAYLQAKLT